ncbi:MAG: N-6 DNA methylase [Chloroflexota bacterium]|nr:N-6 DNA methylase [Chloroflexota bacterium]
MAFADDFLRKYRLLLPRLGHGQSELNERIAWADIVLEGILGYRRAENEYEIEQLGVRRDIHVRNAAGDPILIVETKRSEVGLASADVDQAFGYAAPSTQYVIVTDGTHIRLFRNVPERPLLADLDMVMLTARPRDGDDYRLALPDRAALEQFQYLAREELWAPSYSDFDAPFSQRRSIVSDAAFNAMIADLSKCVGYLYLYALEAFDHFQIEGQRCEEDEQRLTREVTALRASGDEIGAARLELELRQYRITARAYQEFRNGFALWRRLSNREGRSPDENKDVFCKESVYVQLNKLLFIRISEDKDLLARKVSNGGIAVWRNFTTYLQDSYRDLIALAFSDAVHLYRHLFTEGVFDWYLAGDGDLNATLNRVLWRLNLYDFSGVDRDILGKLYEKYFPRDIRKALGEFYTHETVVDFILDAVSYTADRDLRGVTLLDPACGSGTFPVRALGRLLRSLGRLGIPAEERLRQATTNLTGFDINPFACAIAEMNLVFQLIDDYARTGKRAGNLPRIAVFQTDSLVPSGGNGTSANGNGAYNLNFGDTLAPGGSALLADRDAVDDRKAQTYDVIVGNPPYVVTSNVSYRKWYADIVAGGANTYRYFLRAYLPLLKEHGRLGFIVPNTWLADEDSRLFRHWLLADYRLERVISLPYYVKAFYNVDQATTILIARPKQTGDGEAYPLVVGEVRSLEELARHTYRQVETTLDVVVADDERYGLHQSFAIQPVPGVYAVLQRMRNARFPTIVPNLVAAIYNGELGQHERRRISSSPGAGRVICLVGLNIAPYHIDTTSERRNARWYEPSVPFDRDSHAMQPRLVEMSTARLTQRKRIKVGYIDPATVQGDKVYTDSRYANYILSSDCKAPTEYIEGLLNSAPLNFYFKAYSSNNHVNSGDLARLPVPLPNAENRVLADALIDAVQRMQTLHRERDTARNRIAAPLTGVGSLVPLYQSPLITTFPGDTTIGAIISVAGTQVTLTNGAFTCMDEATARLLAIVLRALPGSTSLATVDFPRMDETVAEALSAYDAARTALETFAMNYAALDREIDGYAYDLYGVGDVRNIIEESLRTARADEPDDEDDSTDA